MTAVFSPAEQAAVDAQIARLLTNPPPLPAKAVQALRAAFKHKNAEGAAAGTATPDNKHAA